MTTLRQRRLRLPFAVFGAVLLAVGGLAQLASRTDALRYSQLGEWPSDLPPGEWYLEEGTGRKGYSQDVFWHGIGDSVDHARAADLVILGNSLSGIGFAPDVMEAFAARHGIRWFNLSLPFGETDVMAQAILERQSIRPSIVVVHADPFFTGIPSDYARTVLDTGMIGRSLRRWRLSLGSSSVLLPTGLLPHFVPPRPAGGEGPPLGRRLPVQTYRSVEHGGWIVTVEGAQAFPVEYTEGTPAAESVLARAASFDAEVRSWGGSLIITAVPGHYAGAARVRSVADAAQAPLLLVEPPGLTTYDTNHLDSDSAVRFTEAWVAAFEADPALSSLLDRPPSH